MHITHTREVFKHIVLKKRFNHPENNIVLQEQGLLLSSSEEYTPKEYLLKCYSVSYHHFSVTKPDLGGLCNVIVLALIF
jgi:hypothetical protein